MGRKLRVGAVIATGAVTSVVVGCGGNGNKSRSGPADPGKVAYLMQTTLAVDEAAGIAGALRERFSAARAPGSDDICYATTNRQAAVKELAKRCDLVLVIGSDNSSNSNRLVEVARECGVDSYLIDNEFELAA